MYTTLNSETISFMLSGGINGVWNYKSASEVCGSEAGTEPEARARRQRGREAIPTSSSTKLPKTSSTTSVDLR